MSSEIMKVHVFALVALMCIGSLGTASAQTSAPDPNPEVTARAKDWLHRLQTGDIDRSQLEAQMDAAFTSDLVKQTSTQLGALGDPVTFTFLRAVPNAAIMTYIYRVEFKTTSLNEQFALDKDGKIAGIGFTAPQ